MSAGPDSIDAPGYDSDTNAALNTDIEAELDDKAILDNHTNQRAAHEDVYAQQVLARAQQLEKENADLRVGQAELSTKIDMLSNASQQSQADQQRQARYNALSLSPDEEAAIGGDSKSAVDKLIQRAILETEERLTGSFNKTLEQRTNEALTPLKDQLSSTREELQLTRATQQQSNERDFSNAFAARGVTSDQFFKNPKTAEMLNQRVPGTGQTYFDVFKKQYEAGNTVEGMEIVDHVLSQTPEYSRVEEAAVPNASQSRMVTPEEQQQASDLSELVSQLEKLEKDNSVGAYDAHGGRSKFLEKRNEVLQKIEKHPLNNPS